MKQHIFKGTDQELENALQSGVVEKPYLAYITDFGYYSYNSKEAPYASFSGEEVVTATTAAKAGDVGSIFFFTYGEISFSTDAEWITLQTASTAMGFINYSVSENEGTAERSGHIFVDFTPGSESGNVVELTVNQKGEFVPSEEPLTLEILEDSEGDCYLTGFEVSFDDGASWSYDYIGPVYSGNRIQLKRTLETHGNADLQSLPLFNMKGNVMSVVVGDDYLTATTSSYRLGPFASGSKVVDASQLYFPELASAVVNMFNSVFSDCTNLITPPASLPKPVADTYYQKLYSGCTAMTGTSVLSADTLTNACYQNMYTGCKSLTDMPALPATNLAQNCYRYMFSGCTSLTGVTESLPATTLANACYGQMFRDCTALTAAPELPAETLVGSTTNNAYASMFSGCTSLAYVKALATNASTSSTRPNSWLKDVAATGTFVKKKDATWADGANGIPTGWTVQEVE